MKSVLLSIQPKWCDLIASGKKTVEIRKTRPKIETPFKCYIYETKGITDTPFMDEDGHIDFHGRGQVIGEFICDEIMRHSLFDDCAKILKQSCLTTKEFYSYMGYPLVNPYQNLKEARKKFELYSWHISDLVIYNEPLSLDRLVVEGDCDCRNCGKCSWFIRGNGYDFEGNCDLAYEKKDLRPLFRPPQSWCYVEGLEDEK